MHNRQLTDELNKLQKFIKRNDSGLNNVKQELDTILKNLQELLNNTNSIGISKDCIDILDQNDSLSLEVIKLTHIVSECRKSLNELALNNLANQKQIRHQFLW